MFFVSYVDPTNNHNVGRYFKNANSIYQYFMSKYHFNIKMYIKDIDTDEEFYALFNRNFEIIEGFDC